MHHLVLPVVGEEQPPGPAVPAEPVERTELGEVRVVLSNREKIGNIEPSNEQVVVLLFLNRNHNNSVHQSSVSRAVYMALNK